VANMILAVLTNPVSADRDDEFNEWYTNTHLNDVLKVPGYVAATRFKLVDKPVLAGAEQPKHRYLAIYELDTDDVDRAAAQLQAAVQDSGMFVSDSLDLATAMANFYEQVSDRRKD
jgi:EthD domain